MQISELWKFVHVRRVGNHGNLSLLSSYCNFYLAHLI